MGYGVDGWRQVPVNTSVCGEKANSTRPEIEQIIVQNLPDADDARFERDLDVLRRRIERQVLAETIAFDPGPGGDGGARLKEALKRIQR